MSTFENSGPGGTRVQRGNNRMPVGGRIPEDQQRIVGKDHSDLEQIRWTQVAVTLKPSPMSLNYRARNLSGYKYLWSIRLLLQFTAPPAGNCNKINQRQDRILTAGISLCVSVQFYYTDCRYSELIPTTLLSYLCFPQLRPFLTQISLILGTYILCVPKSQDDSEQWS